MFCQKRLRRNWSIVNRDIVETGISLKVFRQERLRRNSRCQKDPVSTEIGRQKLRPNVPYQNWEVHKFNFCSIVRPIFSWC